MSNIIRNSTTPYVGPIPIGLTKGANINVRGSTEKQDTGLQCGEGTNPRSDCALAFNPRFNDNQVVRNSFQSGSWGPEERRGGFPFRQGESVDVSIVVHAGNYSVNVDGRPFCDYNHRIPLHRVSHISVEQGIGIWEIVFEAPMGYPHPAPGYPSISTGPGESILNPPVPLVHNMGSLYPGKMIFISGIVLPNPSRIDVNFESTPNGPDIAFQCSFKFHADTIVRNTQTINGWGLKERDVNYFPLVPNAYFEMIVFVEQYCYKVAVNNNHLLEYKHRLEPLNTFTWLRLTGDVRIMQVRFQ